MKLDRAALALFTLALLVCVLCRVSAAPALPALQITRLLVSAHSVKVQYAAFPGAADYRCYWVNQPRHMKYAGIVHNFDSWGNHTGDSPNQEIEFNGLAKNFAYTLVVEAVTEIGPVPTSELYNADNQPTQQSAFADGTPITGMDGIGSNMGMVGAVEEVNGQGPSTNVPVAIARATVTVTCTAGEPIPSSIPGASQCVMSPWAGGTIGPLVVSDAANGNGTQTLTSGGSTWTLGWHGADLTASSVFIDHRHLMITLFDGGSSDHPPMHIAHGAASLTPTRTFTGGMIHQVVIVDGHFDARRWVTPLALAPANDPVTNFDAATGPVNKSDIALFVQVQGQNYFVDEYNGVNPDGTVIDIPIAGALGQAPVWAQRPFNGRGLDDRSRFDIFVTPTHVQVYEDGALGVDCDLPVPLSFMATGAQVSEAQYNYHSALGLSELQQYTPYESYWINDVPFSDERHWSDSGVEVLPAVTSWQTVQSYMATIAPCWVRVGGTH